VHDMCLVAQQVLHATLLDKQRCILPTVIMVCYLGRPYRGFVHLKPDKTQPVQCSAEVTWLCNTPAPESPSADMPAATQC
jgi:hypothetical protein